MKISFLNIGKTDKKYLQEGISIYEKRLKRYHTFEIKTITGLKSTRNLSHEVIKQREGELLLKQFSSQDFVILLDEKGTAHNSIAFAKYLQWLLQQRKAIQFVIGGAYGFSDAVYQRSNAQISLSPLTFSHQMVRLIFVEQLYRAFSILRNEPYHHE